MTTPDTYYCLACDSEFLQLYCTPLYLLFVNKLFLNKKEVVLGGHLSLFTLWLRMLEGIIWWRHLLSEL